MLKDNLKIGSLAIVAIALSAFTGCGDNNNDGAATVAAHAENAAAATTPAPETPATNPAATDSEAAARDDNAGDDAAPTASDGKPETEAATAAPEALPAPAATVPVALYENDDEFTAAGTNFSARFSKATGTLSGLVYAGKTLIDGDNGPKLNAFRAVINNDAWIYEKWFQSGLFDLQHTVVGAPVVSQNDDGTATLSFVVKSRGKNAAKLVGDPLIQYGNPINGIPVRLEVGRELGDSDLTFTTHQIWTIYPDGSVELEANITSNLPTFDLPRLGFALGIPAEYGTFSYYGRGPQENYNDRDSGAFVGIYQSPVAEQIAYYAKPQETGNHEDVRWCALTNDDGEGAIFIASTGSFSAAALPVSAMELLMTANPHRLRTKVIASEITTLTLDAGVRGLGGASCGPDTEKRDRIFAEPTDFGFIIRPVAKGKDLSKLANVSPAGAMPIAVVRDDAGNVSISSRNQDAEIRVSINGNPDEEYTGTIPFKNGGTVCAWLATNPNIKTEFLFPKIEKIRTRVIFASSEDGGDETATNLTDDDPDTIWHTAYSVTQADYPHWVDFDVGEVKRISGVFYLPRQKGGNGDVKDYEIYVSNDAQNWGEPVAKGQFEQSKEEQRVMFAQPVDARYIRFRALSSQNGQIYAAGAEFGVLAD
ncbi:MAG: discoidin domain-containing protein [Opitutae bacterium]|nr:discoidin domain-containing protein [Opitutae bacterium]